ncbi:hypothetical protein Bca52824_096772 [Brassica carinata]|uniref:Uncharacterized protein n=1 Tax=Brassica carinata TaxID=52824 RepID=A0A8X7TGI6_BRACI|nr:hypothetical protein Bca52824_096772 [Brassica carinata]
MSFSSSTHRIAVGSFLEDYNNRIDILSFDSDSMSLKPLPSLSFEHPYPPTKLMFSPLPPPQQRGDLLASSGDFLRLWEVNEDSSSAEPVSVLNNSKTSEFCAPLTSFDWNDVEPKRLGTCSIDTTCTIWDVERSVGFASVSADGSVRIFDLRDKEHSTIIYEPPARYAAPEARVEQAGLEVYGDDSDGFE